MTATYEPALPADKDHVRFLIGDTDTAAAKLTDEEIAAVLAEETATGEALKYFAAARCLGVLYLRWASKGEGVMEKEVDDLRVKRGIDGSAKAALDERMAELRERGAFLLRPGQQVFRAV